VTAAPSAEPMSRRDRVRAATVAEIKQTARRLLVDQGADGVSLRAIAREMGMTAPALYRYYDSHETLHAALADDLFADLVAALVAGRDAQPDADVLVRAADTVRAFRRWAVDNPREFAVIFGRPIPTLADFGHSELPNCELFGATFMALFAEIWQHRPFPVRPDAEVDPALAEQLRQWVAQTGIDLPLGALVVYLGLWVRIYGLVALEVFGHLQWALTEVGPLFETLIADMIRQLYDGGTP
jgi:AcrR family transcriptional regulator